MKITKEKLTDFLSGRGFYLVLAACLIAVGVVAWTAYSGFDIINDPVGELSSEDSSLFIYSSEQEVSSELPAGTNAKEPYSSQDVSSAPTSPSADIVARKFTSPIEGEVVKSFSADELTFSKTYKDMRIHSATDFSCEESSAVLSCGNGLVTSVINDAELGVCVEIDHGNGVIAYYCGLKDNLPVSKGTAVNEKTVIGYIGEIPGECADGSHLHLEFYKNGEAVDPMDFIN